MTPRNRHRAPHIVSHHAALRLVERGAGTDRDELADKVSSGAFTFVRRLTARRSLCQTLTSAGPVWFVLDRPRLQVITVLDEAQASELR